MATFLLLPLLTGTFNAQQAFDNKSLFQDHLKKTDDMNCCHSDNTPCPLCLTSNSIYSYLHNETVSYLPILTSSFILIELNSLSDQGIVKAIYHPPTSII